MSSNGTAVIDDATQTQRHTDAHTQRYTDTHTYICQSGGLSPFLFFGVWFLFLNKSKDTTHNNTHNNTHTTTTLTHTFVVLVKRKHKLLNCSIGDIIRNMFFVILKNVV